MLALGNLANSTFGGGLIVPGIGFSFFGGTWVCTFDDFSSFFGCIAGLTGSGFFSSFFGWIVGLTGSGFFSSFLGIGFVDVLGLGGSVLFIVWAGFFSSFFWFNILVLLILVEVDTVLDLSWA